MKEAWNILKSILKDGNKNIQAGYQNIQGNSNVIDNRKIDQSSQNTQINNVMNIYDVEQDKFVHNPVKGLIFLFLNSFPILFFLLSLLLMYRNLSGWINYVFLFCVVTLLCFSYSIAKQDEQFIKNRYPYYYFYLSILLILLTFIFVIWLKIPVQKIVDDYFEKFLRSREWEPKFPILVGNSSTVQLLSTMYNIIQFTITIFTVKNYVMEQNYVFINRVATNRKIFVSFVLYSILAFAVYFLIMRLLYGFPFPFPQKVV